MSEGILNPIQQLQADFDFDVYTKQEVDTLLDGKADKVDTYTKTEADALLNEKAGKSTTLAGYGITDAYTKTQTDNLLNGKADTNSVYTKEETDNLLSAKANSADVYTKTETNNLLSVKADSANVYTKTESNTLLAGKADTDDVYTKTEIDNQLTVTKDGTWVKGTQTTAINLEKLEGGIEYLYGLLSYKYSQLKKYINGNYYDYETNTDTAYTKTVPAGAMPYAGLEKLGGKTLVWNQLYNYSGTSTKNGISGRVSNGLVTLNGTASTSGVYACDLGSTAFVGSKNHVFYGTHNILLNDGDYIRDQYNAANYPAIFTQTRDYQIPQLHAEAGSTYTDVSGYIMLFDLTLMFGAGNEPSTVEEFQQMFPAEYYPYNAGELLSAGVTEVVSKGKNLADISVVKALYPSLVTIVSADEFTFTSSNAIISTNRFIDNTEKRSGRMSISYSVKYDDATHRGVYLRVYYTNGSLDRLYNSTATNTWRTVSWTSSATKTVDYVAWSYESDNVLATFKNLQIEWGTTATSYTPYKSISYPVPASIQSLEGCGWSAGSVYNYIDYERKVFVKRVGSKTISSADVNLSTYIYTNITYAAIQKPTDFAGRGNANEYGLVSDKYVVSNVTTNWDDASKVNQIFYRSLNNVIWFGMPYGTTLATAQSELDGTTIYYELATPIEVDISAYITDDNLIEVEAGGTLTFPNSNGDNYRIPVPSTQEYMINLQEAVSNG